jgi:hypothetical protein
MLTTTEQGVVVEKRLKRMKTNEKNTQVDTKFYVQ